MFIGHFALAFGAKKAAPKISLGTLFLAVQLADLVWATLVLIGIETVVVAPAHAKGPLPVLFRRTPYDGPANANFVTGAAFKDFVQDGYIFVVQNLRGRFGSEGVFELSMKADLENPKATSGVAE